MEGTAHPTNTQGDGRGITSASKVSLVVKTSSAKTKTRPANEK